MSTANDQPSPCDELQSELAAYALGEAPLSATLRAHLADCARCQQDLRAYAHMARVLPYAAPPVAPPPELRERVLAIATGQPLTTTARARPLPPRRRSTFGWAGLALACAALIALLGWNVALRAELAGQRAETGRVDQIAALLAAPDVRSFALTGAVGSGRVLISAQRNQAYLVVEGLPNPGAGNVYQMWLIRGQNPVSAGTFEAASGVVAAAVEASQPLTDFGAFGVTVEPRGGSAAPTNQPILAGALDAAAPLYLVLSAALAPLS